MLVVYYSKTRNTGKIAEEFAKILECDIEEIVDTKNLRNVRILRFRSDVVVRKLTVQEHDK